MEFPSLAHAYFKQYLIIAFSSPFLLFLAAIDIPLSAIIHHLQRRAAPQQHSQIPTLDNHTIQDRPRGISDTAKRPPAKTRAAPTSPPCKKAGRRYLESWFKKKVITDALPVSSCRNAECENRGKGNAVCPSISTWDYDADRYPPFVPSVRCLRAPPREDGLECLPVAIRRKVLFRNKRVCRSGGKERWDVQQKEVGSSHCAFSSRSTPGAHSKR